MHFSRSHIREHGESGIVFLIVEATYNPTPRSSKTRRKGEGPGGAVVEAAKPDPSVPLKSVSADKTRPEHLLLDLASLPPFQSFHETQTTLFCK